ncbi:MAG: PilZ domain-containing protein [Candidatus Omnitrophica bacterium]|nr:PilZ domain-containing protein [Candidatus Omnitrophota bacterium]
MINHRRDLRIKTDLPATGYLHGKETELNICNISRSGACLHTKNQHAIYGNTVQLNFKIPFINKNICLIAEKKRQKYYQKELTIGVEFLNITLKEKMEIGYFIDSMIFSNIKDDNNAKFESV